MSDGEKSPQSSPPLAFLPLYLGVTSGMTFGERLRILAQNAGAWLMIGFGSLFVVLNAAQGSVDYVGLNCAFIATGALSLWLIATGFRGTALAVISIGSCITFFFASLWFRNGMENYLLVTMVATLLLFEDAWTRVAIAGLNAAAYSFVRLAPAITMNVENKGYQNVLNILLFILALTGMIEFFRVLNSDYLASLEKSNKNLGEANKAKEKLFSVISHDLRGPVGNLKSSLELLQADELGREEFSELVGDLAADVDNSHACMENLLSWSTSQLGGLRSNPTVVDLKDLWTEVSKFSCFAAKRKHISITAELPKGARVIGDNQQLQAIFRNLLSNSIKFTPLHGKIHLSAEKQGPNWKISLVDSGIGMRAERAETLFQETLLNSTPGTEDEPGLGLGLEICREFTTLNGGTIRAHSMDGQGTTIEVVFAAAP